MQCSGFDLMSTLYTKFILHVCGSESQTFLLKLELGFPTFDYSLCQTDLTTTANIAFFSFNYFLLFRRIYSVASVPV